MPSTYNSVYLSLRSRLRKAGIEAADLEARELVCSAAGKNRREFYRDLQLYTSDQVAEKAEEYCRRRLEGEPVAYIIGEWEFYGIRLLITPDVLIPRTDTEVLAGRAMDLALQRERPARVLDLCTGSGCIGLAVAERVPESRVTLADISEPALALCRQNIRLTGLGRQAVCIKADALEEPSPSLRDFDLLLCNPPYIPSGDIRRLDPSVRDYEPRLALDGGEDGLDFCRSIARRWGRVLKPGGALLMETGIGQARQAEEILEENGFTRLHVYRDTGGIERVVEAWLPG